MKFQKLEALRSKLLIDINAKTKKNCVSDYTVLIFVL